MSAWVSNQADAITTAASLYPYSLYRTVQVRYPKFTVRACLIYELQKLKKKGFVDVVCQHFTEHGA